MTDRLDHRRSGPETERPAAQNPGRNGGLAGSIADRYAEGGAGFMHDLGLTITEAEPGRVRFTLEVTDRLVHGGGVLCGQTILACMDTGMVFVMMSINEDPDVSFTTVQLQTAFERGVPDDVGEVTFEAQATKSGRSLVFGQIDLFLPDGRRAASATTTYMWL